MTVGDNEEYMNTQYLENEKIKRRIANKIKKNNNSKKKADSLRYLKILEVFLFKYLTSAHCSFLIISYKSIKKTYYY